MYSVVYLQPEQTNVSSIAVKNKRRDLKRVFALESKSLLFSISDEDEWEHAAKGK